MIVTKHCEPHVRDLMLKGAFKLGTLEEYAQAEGGGLMGDKGEGQTEIQIPGPLNSVSFQLGSNSFTNFTVCGNPERGAIAVGIQAHASVFCASAGPYRVDRHEAILRGWEGYEANPKYSAYVELDVDRLREALHLLGVAVYGRQFVLIDRKVDYRRRTHDGDAANITAALSDKKQVQAAIDAVFIKPERFRPEDEYRFALIRHGGVRPLMTDRFPGKIVEAFRLSIHSSGH